MKQRGLTDSITKTESVRSYDQLLLQECCTPCTRYNKTIITQWKEGNLHDGYILYTIYTYLYYVYLSVAFPNRNICQKPNTDYDK